MRIAVLANLKKNAPTWEGMPADQWDDLDSPKTTDALVAALQAGGHEATFFEASILPPYNLIDRLREYKPDLCFNISESHFGNGRESHIPSILEMLRIPYTGSKVLTLALALDKPLTKRILCYHGLPTPEFQVFERADEPIDSQLLNEAGELRFPLFVKPSREGTSMGISAECTVHTVKLLREQVAKQIRLYNQPILVEHYIEGREITIGMVGNLKPADLVRPNDRTGLNARPEGLTFLPPLEINLSTYAQSESSLYTNRMKTEWADGDYYLCPAKVDPDLLAQLQLLAAAVFRVVDCKDVARVDFRVDTLNGEVKPYILEINPLPGMNPGYSDLCMQSRAAGWSYEKLVNMIVDLAAERQGVKIPA